MSRELAAWLRLTLIPGIGAETQRQLLKALEDPEAIFSAPSAALRGILGAGLMERLRSHDCRAEVEAALNWAALAGNHILTLADAAYPQALLTAADPPVLLYAKGDIGLLNRPGFAIVGSRNATKQGEVNAEAFAATLCAAGFVIVSGLAAGIDAAAHRGALAATGVGATVAVIGTGIDRIYPARNEALAREIVAHGAIISEFPLGTPPLPANFPRRNRLIAGLGQGCLVVEAARQSGSLITARLAAEAGREVFAIPGSIHSPQSKGCHALIKQGAKLVESAQDILEELGWGRGIAAVPPVPKRGFPSVTPTLDAAAAGGGEDPILHALGHDPCDLETLAARCGLPPETVLARLLPLELDGRIAPLPGGRYQRLG